MKPNIYILLLTAFLDFLSSTLNTITLIFLPGSVYEMLFGFELISVAIFSKIFLKTIISKNQWIGLMGTFAGLILVGFSDIFFTDSNETKSI
jgi:drug/metabolite transporter (DMT)-like permease